MNNIHLSDETYNCFDLLLQHSLFSSAREGGDAYVLMCVFFLTTKSPKIRMPFWHVGINIFLLVGVACHERHNNEHFTPILY
jgi:hypothetical protein